MRSLPACWNLFVTKLGYGRKKQRIETIKVFSSPEVTIDGVRIEGNFAEDDVGGLGIINDSSVVTVKNSTISGNWATPNSPNVGYPLDAVAGVYLRGNNGAETTIESSTISRNRVIDSSAPGGGLFIRSLPNNTTIIRNTTVSGNEAEGNGAGVVIDAHPEFSGGAVEFQFCTITQNRANSDDEDSFGAGGGIWTSNSSTTTSLYHTIVAENYRGNGTAFHDDILGTVTANWSFIGKTSAGTFVNGQNNQIGTASAISPNLAPLAWNGGPTQTHRPNAGSDVIDAGDPSAEAGDDDVPLYDQRGVGFPRRVNVPNYHDSGDIVDIGAYEIGLPKVIDVRLSGVRWDNVTPWVDEISYAALVPLGQQLAPIYRHGTNQIQIIFSEAITNANGDPLVGSEMTLVATGDMHSEETSDIDEDDFDPATNTWTFANLGIDRYRIDIDATDIKGLAGKLAGHWKNLFGPTEGTPEEQTLYDWENDQKGRTFLTSGNSGTAFQFLSALNPGDYNQNGIVETWDYPFYLVVDGDGDGQVGQTGDSAVYGYYYDSYLQFQRWQGDYNLDGTVDCYDWRVWRNNYGALSGPGLTADGNGDGEVDTSDYVNWSTWRNTVGAWYLSPHGAASGMALVDSTTAPRVMNVTISGSNSTHDPYSYATHVGDGSDQLRTVPVGGADTVSITFDEEVNVEASYLRVVGYFTANLPELAEFSYDAVTMTATWRFENWIANDIYVLQLSDAVTDLDGYRLDGEWMNPGMIGIVDPWISDFPSGDGHAGGGFSFLVTLFAGDANLDNLADSADYDIWENYLSSAGDFTAGDFNGDGVVGLDDFALWELAEGRNLQGGVGIRGDIGGDVDWRVDDSDFEVVRANLGMTGASREDGDMNGDGTVDMDDVDFMMAQLGLEVSVTI